MASKMEVESTSPPTTTTTTTTEDGKDEKKIKIHPLAIIGISDHHTRVTYGGSIQSPDSTIIGLLFGYQKGNIISIIDAEEVEYRSSSLLKEEEEGEKGGGSSSGGEHNNNEEEEEAANVIKTKINLHTKVFPLHTVVGWYRVSNESSSADENDEILPNDQDMIVNNNWMKEYNPNPVFVLMNIPPHQQPQEEEEKKKKERTSSTDMDTDGQDAREKLDRDERLPLCIFETLAPSSSSDDESIFVGMEFELETFEPERIAVEKVFKTQSSTAVPTPEASSSSSSSTTTTITIPSTSDMGESKEEESNKGEKKDDKGNNTDNTTVSKPPKSTTELHMESLRSSIESMNARVAVLLDFLRKTQSGEIPPDHALLRQVASLVKQLPFVMGRGGDGGMKDGKLKEEFENDYDDVLITAYLASIAETTTAVLSYSQKFQVSNETFNRENISGRKGRA